MKKVTKALVKQGIKYFFYIVLGITSLFIAKIFWLFPAKIIIIGAITGIVILIIGLILDIMTMKDVIPLLKN